MNELVIKTITIKSTDYKDNDKIVKFFSPQGIISAQIKGIKKANAKLKFCVQPFCFSEVVLHKNNNFYTVTGAQLIDSFFDLTQDIERYIAGCAILESLDAFEPTYSNDAFVLTLKSFSTLLNARPREALIKYFLDALKYSGYEYTYNACAQCGKSLNNKIWFDISEGVMCVSCKTPQAIPLSPGAQSAIRIIDDTSLEKLPTLKLNENALYEAITLIAVIYKEKNNITLNSIKSLL